MNELQRNPLFKHRGRHSGYWFRNVLHSNEIQKKWFHPERLVKVPHETTGSDDFCIRLIRLIAAKSRRGEFQDTIQ